MTTESLDALVLVAHDAGASRVVHILTEADQRLPVVVPQARRRAKKLGAHLDPVTRVNVTLREEPRRDLPVVTEATARHPFPVVKADLVRLGLAQAMAEVVLALVLAHAAEPGVFALLDRAWRVLDDPRRRADEELLLLFEVRALTLAGLLPDLSDPHALPTVPPEARDVALGWLEGRWATLEPGPRRALAGALEAIVQETSGRALKARAFLDQVLPPGA